MKNNSITLVAVLALLVVKAGPAMAQSTESKPASPYTVAANAALLESMPFDDTEDFDNASRGFISRPDTLTIVDSQGNIVWDLEQYKSYISLDAPAPDTVNPSLWRNALLPLIQ